MSLHPHTIGFEQSLNQAKQMMYSLGIRHLPVLQGGVLVGIISDRDIKLAFAVDRAAAGECTVGDSCTNEVFSVDVNEDLVKVTAEMGSRGLGCCVVTQQGKTVGIFTTVDACKVLTQLLETVEN